MSYSLDFRKRVLAVQEKQQLTFEEISKRFGVSARTIFRRHERIEPIMKRNKPATKVNMESLKADVQKGERCPGEYDWHARGRLNAIGAILGFAFLTVCLFDSNVNSDVFYALTF